MESYQTRTTDEFDLRILGELKGLQMVPVADFDAKVAAILKKKSPKKLWWSNLQVEMRDGESLRECNYRCVPESDNAHNYFCLILDRKSTGISVTDGWLSPL
jgi:hypothetical protein